jgi:hypothetical protein
MNEISWDNPAHEPLSNGPIRTVTGSGQPKVVLNSSRREIEYLLSFPFHLVDPSSWHPIEFLSNGVPITIYKRLAVLAKHRTDIQVGTEETDAYCTVIRLSTPLGFELSSDDGWKIVKQMLEWVRVKCRHYWLLHGIGGFGAAYRGTVFVRDGQYNSQHNIALYGPNVIVNPLTSETWSTLPVELAGNAEVPIADSIYCDALVSVVAGAPMKALLEAGVAMEIALTRLLVDVSGSGSASAAKTRFRKGGDHATFGKKLHDWTRELGLDSVETYKLETMSSDWHETVKALYKLRNGVAHGGQIEGAANFTEVAKGMFAAGALLQYCREQRLKLGLEVFSMAAGTSPWKQLRQCHDANMSVTGSPSSVTLS